jgi:hypothetical protein
MEHKQVPCAWRMPYSQQASIVWSGIYPEPEARDKIYQYLPTHAKTQNTFILASRNYFDSDMSKSTNTVVYFDWKTGIDFPVVNIHLDELSFARIWQHKFSLRN